MEIRVGKNYFNIIEMKELKFLSVFLLGIVLSLFFACSKEKGVWANLSDATSTAASERGQEASANQSEIEYQIDLVVVKSFEVNFEDTTVVTLIESDVPTGKEGSLKMIIHKFTNKELYYNYGEQKGRKARQCDQITERLAFLADSLDMENIVARTGVVPSWWFDLEASVVAENLSHYGSIVERGAMTQINDNMRYQCRNGESSKVIFALPGVGMPNLWLLGWCNDPSGFFTLIFGGIDMAFDKPWYRKKLFNWWAWGFNGYDLCGPLSGANNKSCSWWSGGI